MKYLTTVYVVWKLNRAYSHFDAWKSFLLEQDMF